MIKSRSLVAASVALGALAVVGWAITGFSPANDLRGVAAATLLMFAVSAGCAWAAVCGNRIRGAMVLGAAVLTTGLLAQATIMAGTWPVWSGHAALRAGDCRAAALHFEAARSNYMAPALIETTRGRMGSRGCVLSDLAAIETFRGIALVESGAADAGAKALESALKAAQTTRPPEDVEYIEERLEWARGR